MVTGPSPGSGRHPYCVGDPETDRHLAALAERYTDPPHRGYLSEILTTAIKMGQELANTGDFKLVNTSLKELRYALKVFEPYREIRKVAMFGSARVRPGSPIYELALAFAREITGRSFMLITGGDGGIMEAGNRAAGAARSFGVNIRLPQEQPPNAYIKESPHLINFKYFFTRKLSFIKESHATVLLPGGFGTHDEAFETLTLVQTGKCSPRPIVLLEPPGSTYWSDWEQFVRGQLVAGGFIDDEDVALYRRVQSVTDAVAEIESFYRVYHSIRFVGDLTVLRLSRPVPPAVVADLNGRFRDLLVGGEIRLSEPLKPEREHGEYLEHPRLVMPFNRRSFGRLRALIDDLNQVAEG